MQADPRKPTLKALGTKPLKLKYDELLSRFAFKFNLRHYTEVWMNLNNVACWGKFNVTVRRCSLTVSKLVLKAPMVSALETIMSQAAFNCCCQFQLAPLHHGAG